MACSVFWNGPIRKAIVGLVLCFHYTVAMSLSVVLKTMMIFALFWWTISANFPVMSVFNGPYNKISFHEIIQTVTYVEHAQDTGHACTGTSVVLNLGLTDTDCVYAISTCTCKMQIF